MYRMHSDGFFHLSQTVEIFFMENSKSQKFYTIGTFEVIMQIKKLKFNRESDE